MVLNFPLLLGYSIETIQEKLKFYKDLGIEEKVLVESQLLYFPLELVRARIECIRKKSELDYKSVDHLFFDDSHFYKKYKVTREELLKGEF